MGISAPTPILPRAKLAELQDRAIERGDAERVRNLEEIRVALAAEAEAPVRTEAEVGRLAAQFFVARAGLAAEQESARRFEENKYLLRWNLNGESEGDAGRAGEKSLAEVERSVAWEEDQAKFIGSRYVHWDDDRRREAQVRVEKLTRQRELLLDRIEAERAAIFDQVAHKVELVALLYQIHSKEERQRLSEGREMPAPLFSLQELKRLDTVASRLRDPDFYRTLARLERDYDARTDQREWVSVATRVGRAQACVIMAEISLRKSFEEGYHRFNRAVDTQHFFGGKIIKGTEWAGGAARTLFADAKSGKQTLVGRAAGSVIEIGGGVIGLGMQYRSTQNRAAGQQSALDEAIDTRIINQDRAG